MDDLRDKIGYAIRAAMDSGAPEPDYFDSREIDRLADAALVVVEAEVARLKSVRHCIRCNTEIVECMGMCLARDLIGVTGDESPFTPRPIANVRELCGCCSMRRDKLDFLGMLLPEFAKATKEERDEYESLFTIEGGEW